MTLELIFTVLGAVVFTALVVVSAAHVVLNKYDDRTAAAWVGFILFVPLFGTLLYWLLGNNRVRREASKLRGGVEIEHDEDGAAACPVGELVAAMDDSLAYLGELAELSGRVTGRPLLQGNAIEGLIEGETAYPAMLDAIRGAEHSVALATYIFNRDDVGERFAEALGEASERGVEVRVLIDAAGARYSWPRSILNPLRRRGVRVVRFHPVLAPWNLAHVNMRNHRKILITDGRLGFTGGMNIAESNTLPMTDPRRTRDLHFKLQGPCVEQLMTEFAKDWKFSANEDLNGKAWFPSLAECGSSYARVISDGPDADYGKLEQVLIGAITTSKSRVRVVTPYFLPSSALLSSLTIAALRGVKVEILLPEKNNFRFMTWAAMRRVETLVRSGCFVRFSTGPFDHSKLCVVDSSWVLMGSANWDPRSLSLNFELNVEIYDVALGAQMDAFVDGRTENAVEVTTAMLASRSLYERLRDGVVRLASPYL